MRKTLNHDTAVTLWLVEDDAGMRLVLEQAMRDAGIETRLFEDLATARAALDADALPDVLMTDLMLPDGDGFELLDQAQGRGIPVIVITAHSDLENAVAAYGRGAFEYLAKPFDLDQAVSLVRRATPARIRDQLVRSEDAIEYGTGRRRPIVGRSPAMQALFRAIGRLAGSAMPVLIQGESGTGKELVARALHEHSPRAGGPFVAMNTAAVPSELLESELFGHERGAFTGADRQRAGRFEEADGGTLFLDEIGDMPLALQTRMLRALAEGEFHRVGGQRAINVDVRVIAATHQDLSDLVASGRFREDLLHRLDVIRLQVPPLRERPEDVTELLAVYLQEASREAGVPQKHLSEAASAALVGFAWPGNVRQLINLCRRLTALVAGREIRISDLPAEVRAESAHGPDWLAGLLRWARGRWDAGDTGVAADAVAEAEAALLRAALERTAGHKQNAARLLGWGRNTLTRKLKE
jgi:two-component system, NtrC family, nitrogen regulation response regulator GlnG